MGSAPERTSPALKGRCTKQKSPPEDGFLRDLVAWGGIEPPTRGFSIYQNPLAQCQLSAILLYKRRDADLAQCRVYP